MIRFPTPRGVFAKLVTVLLVIGLVPFLGMEWWTYRVSKEQMTETVIEYWLVRLARETAVQLDNEVQRMRDLAQGWAEDEVLAADLPAADSALSEATRNLQNYLRNRHKTRLDQIDYMFVTDTRGRIVADSLPPIKGSQRWRTPLTGVSIDAVIEDPQNRRWIHDAMTPTANGDARENRRPTLSSRDWHRSRVLECARQGGVGPSALEGPSRNPKDYALGFAGAVIAPKSGAVLGAIGVIFNWTRIQGILDGIQIRFQEVDQPGRSGKRYDSGYGFLFANDRDTIIAHRPAEGSPLDGVRPLIHNSLIRNHGLRVFHDRMRDDDYGSIRYEYPPGTPKITGFAGAASHETGGFGWHVGMGINDDQIFADVRVLRNLLAVAALIATGLVILGAAVFSHRMTEPLTRLIRYTQEVGRGNLDARVNVGTNDEIAVLADSFNKMTEDLKESNRRLIEAEKNAAWQEMARQVAHEIKNPLTPIKLSAQQIQRAFSDGHPGFESIMQESVDSIIEQCESLRAIASDFAAFAAFENRRLKEENLRELVEGTVTPFVESDTSNVATTLDILAPADTRVLADRSEIRRVILNLINNAHQAMPNGGTLEVEVALTSDGREARVSFNDTGCGIPDEDREHLFEPYFSTRTGGTGLGLALCNKIIQGHRGRIEVESSSGKGTRMIFTIPVI